MHVGIAQRRKETKAIAHSLFSVSDHMYTHAINIKLTFASLYTLKPPVINVSIAGSSAVLKPSTARSATTDSAGSAERAALWTRYCMSDN